MSWFMNNTKLIKNNKPTTNFLIKKIQNPKILKPNYHFVNYQQIEQKYFNSMSLDGCPCCVENVSGPAVSFQTCFLISFTSAVIGFVLGLRFQYISRYPKPLSETADSNPQLATKQPPEESLHILQTEDSETNAQSKTLDFGSHSQAGPLNVAKSTFAHRNAKVEYSLRKLSVLSGLPHGLIEARGKDLEIVKMDRVVRCLLGYEKGANRLQNGARSVVSPQTVHDLLPIELRSQHRRFFAKAVEDGDLPSSLMHPMRNIQMLRQDGSVVRVNLCVGVITKVRSLLHAAA